MTVPSFTALAPSYARLWAGLVPTPEHLPALRTICTKLIANKALYRQVAQAVWGNADYWYVVALLDQMEGGGGCKTYLGNGQSLHKVTTEVPAGRGPFPTFLAGCKDALHLDGLDKITSWPIERIAYEFEAWNGWGYLSKPINDPYLVSFSNEYTEGKYIGDHDYDAHAVSGQPGALTILKVLITLDPSIKLTALSKDPIVQPTVSAIATAGAAPLPPVTATETTVTTTASAPAAAGGIDYAQLAAAIVAAQAAAAPPPPQITLASIEAHLNALLPIATVVLSSIPATAPYAPALSLAQKTIAAVSEVTTTMQTSPADVPAVLAGHINDIAPLVAALKPVSAQIPWLVTLEGIIGNIAAALTPPPVAPPVAKAP
jgi:lysozyme family protein